MTRKTKTHATKQFLKDLLAYIHRAEKSSQSHEQTIGQIRQDLNEIIYSGDPDYDNLHCTGSAEDLLDSQLRS